MDKKALVLSILIYALIILLTVLIKFSPFEKAPEYISLGFISEEISEPSVSKGAPVTGGESYSQEIFQGDVPMKVEEPKKGLPPEEKPSIIGSETPSEATGTDDKGYKIQGEIATRKLIRFVKPVYPEGENQNTEVRLEVTVDSLGYVKKIEVLKTGGYNFDRSAIEAVRAWRFMPLRGVGDQKGEVIVIYRLK